MRNSLKDLKYAIEFYGTDLEDKDIDLRNILMEMLKLIDQALPLEIEPN